MNTLPQFSAPNTGALRFADIDNESVSVAHDAALSAANFTIEAWVTTTNTDADFNRVVTKAVGGAQTYSIVVINGEAQIRSSVGTVTSTGITVADGNPHHIAGVYDSVAETLALYVDGALISTISTAGQTLVQGTEDVFIGDYPGAFVEAFDGDISDVRIWSDVRTTEEIAATFDQSLDGGAPNLELHLRFDGDATDSSGNGRDGVINGAPVFVEGLAPVDPLAFDPMTLAATEDVAEAITGLQVSDADPGAILTVTVEVASGALILATTTGLTFTAGGNGSATFTAQGTVADLNAALATLSYLGDPDFNGADNIILTVDDGQADVAEPVAGAQVIPNSGTFFLFDFDTGIGFTEAQTAADPVNPPTNGVYIVINPNNDHWSTGASLVVDGVITVLPPENFDLVGYVGASSITAGTLARFEDAITGLTLIYTNEDTPTPTGARDITFTFNGLDFADTPPGDMNVDDADFRMSSEAVQTIPVTVAAVADAAPVVTNVQATGEVFEAEEGTPTALAPLVQFEDFDGSDGFGIAGAEAEERLGNSVAGLGDVNGDGFDDFVIGAYRTDLPGAVDAGAAHIIFGTDTPFPADFDFSTLDGTNGFTFNGTTASDLAGRSVDGIGDINSDGFDDILIGASSAGEVFSSGEAYLVYGKASGFDATLTAADLDGTIGTALGGINFSAFGQAVSNAGDVNGDGIDDLIIGAQVADVGGLSQVGASYVLFGQVGGFGASFNFTTLDGTNGFAIEGVDAGDRTGIAVDGGGDINGDGFDDLLVGAYRADSGAYSNNGAVYVVFGDGAPVTPTVDLATLDGTNGFLIEGNADLQSLGQSISFIGDINNDGVDDFAIGIPSASPNGVGSSGQVHVVFGDSIGAFPANLDIFSLDGTDGFVVTGTATGERVGTSVSSAGDLNGDGIDDLLIGGDGGAFGEAFVVYGSGGGFGATFDLNTLDGFNGVEFNGGRVGVAVASIGDVDGDGVDDIIAANRNALPNGSSSGQAFTAFGVSENSLASGEIQFTNGTSRDSHTVSSVETSFTGLGVFTAEIVDAHDPNGLGIVEWTFQATAAELDPLAAGETIVQTYDVTIANPDASTVQTISVTINGANDTPFASEDAFVTDEETILSGDLLADNGFGPDFDIDNGDTLDVIEIDGVAVNDGDVVTLASGAELTIRADGTFDYDPNGQFETVGVGATANDAFTYTITDGEAAPADQIGGALTIPAHAAFILDFDTGLTSSELNFGASVPPLNGVVITLNPNPINFEVVAEIFENGASTFSSADFSLPGYAGASGPTVGGQRFAFEDDITNLDLTWSRSDVPSPTGLRPVTFTFTDLNFVDNAAGDATISGSEVGDGISSSTAVVNLTINGVNDDPVAQDDSFAGDEDASIFGDLFADNGAGPDADLDSVFTVSEINGGIITDGEIIPIFGAAALTINTDGTFEIDPNGEFDFLPEGAMGPGGAFSFDYTIVDDQGATAIATASINFTGVNDAPVAADDAFSTDEVTLLSGDLFGDNGFGPDSDIDDGDFLTLFQINGVAVADGEVVTLPSGATLTIRMDGTFDYDRSTAFANLAEGQTDLDSFTYTIGDQFGAIDVATANITVTGVNDAPFAFDESFDLDADTPLFSSLFFDPNSDGFENFDPDGDALSISQINGAPVFDGQMIPLASGASLVIRSDGSFDYDPLGQFETLAQGTTATDSFTYQINDGFGGVATATANLNIAGVNAAPVAQDDLFTSDEDSVVSGDLFADNGFGPDADIDAGSILSVTEIDGAPVSDGQTIGLPSGADLTIRSDGTFDYDINGGFDNLAVGETGTASFTYTIADEFGATATATANITYTGVNDVPTAVDEAFSTAEDTPIVGGDLNDKNLGEDSDPEGPFTYTQINGVSVVDGQTLTIGSGALLTIRSDGTFDYDPNGAFGNQAESETGADSFAYTIEDEFGATATATASITVFGVNEAPQAFDEGFDLSSDAPVVGNLLFDANSDGFLAFDPDGDVLSVSQINGAPVSDGDVITLASGAVLVINTDGTFDYDPQGQFAALAQGETSTDSFTYQISDGFGGTTTANAIFTFASANNAPTAFDDRLFTDEDSIVSGDLLADNSFGPDVDPNAGAILTVTEVNGAPVTDGQVVTLFSGALLTIRADGTFDYNPAGAFEALGEGDQSVDDFSYTIADEFGVTASATAIFTVNGVNDAPVALFDDFATDANSPVSGDLTADNGFGGDFDIDAGDTLQISAINGQAITDGEVISLPSGAQLTIRLDGTFDYDPVGAFAALGETELINETFTYTLSDSQGATSQSTAGIAISGVNDAPVAVDDVFTGDENTIITGSLLVENGGAADQDVDGDVLAVAQINGAPVSDGDVVLLPSGALLTIRADGTFDYDPAGAFPDLVGGDSAADSFTYTLTDNQGGASEATVSLTVNGVNEAPDVRDDAFTLSENASISGNFFADNGLGADTDGDNDTLSIVQIAGLFLAPGGAPVTATLGSGAEVTFSSDGAFTYEAGAAFDALAAGEVATEQLGYFASDQQGGFGMARATFTVIGVNDAPLARDDAFSTDEDTPIGGLFLLADNGAGADTDQDGDAISLASIDGVDVSAGDTVLLSSGGAVLVGVGGEVAYDPNGAFEFLEGGEATTDSFVYQTTDGQGGVSEATVRVEIAGVSDILFGTAESDVLEGTAGADDIRALDGGDFVSGFAGDDIIDGGAGDDRARGGEGEDSITGGDGDDALFGESGDDVLAGGGGADRLRGQRGDDRLLGQAGDDVLAGARGDDTLIGGGGDDTLAGGAENDRLRGQAGDDKLGGSRGDDVLQGGSGADRIRGGGGDDTLNGGADDDTLIGGAGDDVFQFAGNDGVDVIRRFEHDADLIQITSEGIGFDDLAIVQQGANVAISFASTELLLTAQTSTNFGEEDFIFLI